MMGLHRVKENGSNIDVSVVHNCLPQLRELALLQHERRRCILYAGFPRKKQAHRSAPA
jgi:hypothetical protein